MPLIAAEHAKPRARLERGPISPAPEIAGAPNRTSATREAFEIQERALHGLHELVEELEQRLEPVLAPAVPQPADPDKAHRAEVMLVRTIEAMTTQVVVSRERLRAILDRIAL